MSKHSIHSISSKMPNSKTEGRKELYKPGGMDLDEARSRREDSLVELRNNQREDNLSNKRTEEGHSEHLVHVSQSAASISIENLRESIPTMIQGVKSDDPVSQFESTNQFINLLSIEECNPPFDGVIKSDHDVVQRFVQFLGRHDLPQLQLAAARLLTILASQTSELTVIVVKHGAVPHFMQLLDSANDDVREQAVLALGRVACSSTSCRDFVLARGALTKLLGQFNEHAKLSMLRNATWTLYKFCDGTPPPPFDWVMPVLPILKHLFCLNDEEVLKHACSALNSLLLYATDFIEAVNAVIEAGFCQVLPNLLFNPSHEILIPAIRILRKLAKVDVAHRQAVLEAKIIPPLVCLLQQEDLDIKMEAAFPISFLISGASHEQIQFLVSLGGIKPLCDLLVCPAPLIVAACLKGLENILKVGEANKEMGMDGGVNLYVQMIDDCSGLDKIKNQKTYGNRENYEIATRILRTYWGEKVDQNVQLGVRRWRPLTKAVRERIEAGKAREEAHQKKQVALAKKVEELMKQYYSNPDNPVLDSNKVPNEWLDNVYGRDVTFEEFEKHNQQVADSDGFDVDPLPDNVFATAYIRPVTIEGRRAQFSEYAKLAIKEYNENENTNFEFLELEKVNELVSKQSEYYITFKANEDGGAINTFQALVLYIFVARGQFETLVDFCRLKTTTYKKGEASHASDVSTSPCYCTCVD